MAKDIAQRKDVESGKKAANVTDMKDLPTLAQMVAEIKVGTRKCSMGFVTNYGERMGNSLLPGLGLACSLTALLNYVGSIPDKHQQSSTLNPPNLQTQTGGEG